MTELPAAIVTAVCLVVCGNVYYAIAMRYIGQRGMRLSRLERWLQHLRYQADNYDGERMFAAGLCVVVLVAILAGAG
jgi:hypothetical protein